jgi:hypothetical protein
MITPISTSSLAGSWLALPEWSTLLIGEVGAMKDQKTAVREPQACRLLSSVRLASVALALPTAVIFPAAAQQPADGVFTQAQTEQGGPWCHRVFEHRRNRTGMMRRNVSWRSEQFRAKVASENLYCVTSYYLIPRGRK